MRERIYPDKSTKLFESPEESERVMILYHLHLASCQVLYPIKNRSLYQFSFKHRWLLKWGKRQILIDGGSVR